MKAIIFTCLLACGLAAADPAWNDFRGSFLVLKEESFAQFPRTIREDLFSTEGWTAVSSTANDCTNGGKFNGIQHVKANATHKDYSVGLLFDVNGVIAGIQVLLPHEALLTSQNPTKYDAVPMYNNATYEDKEYFVLTAYMVDPSTICSTGRSDDALDTEGTGYGLWIQNGPTPDTLLEVPQARPEGEEAVSTGWTQNKCFVAMGHHNFYKQNEYRTKDCTEMNPMFALYNRAKELHGFGFIVPGTVDNPRFEHPPQAAIKKILGDTPQCVLDIEENIGLTSLHVYFRARPWFTLCPLIQSETDSGSTYLQSARNWLHRMG